jgi:hypothetical protein
MAGRKNATGSSKISQARRQSRRSVRTAIIDVAAADAR